MIPPHLPDDHRAERLRHLLALEISRIITDLDARREALLAIWSRHRKREPFLDTLFSRWSTLGFPLLSELEPAQASALDGFYRELEEFRLYLCFTQDMPANLAERFDRASRRLATRGRAALDTIGGEPERPLVDFDDAEEDSASQLLHMPGAAAPGRPATADDDDPGEE